MTCQAPTPKRIEMVLYEGDENANGNVNAARVFIVPGSPLVWMHVAVYFRANVQGYTETHDATDDVTLHTFVRDPRQGNFVLDAVVSDSQLPFTWEGVTAADGLRLLVTQGDFGAAGNLVAVVTFHPAAPMTLDQWEALAAKATAFADPAQRQVVSV